MNNNICDFDKKLNDSGLYPLKSNKIETLQINLGYLCNLTCDNCHVNASPSRKEIMNIYTIDTCLDVIKNNNIKTVDLTGGAPEMNPNFVYLIEELGKLDIEILVRSNLVIYNKVKYVDYPEVLKKNKVKIISSLPCYTADNVDKQRGDGVFGEAIKVLRMLNSIGYGINGSGLELNLVYNPGGAFLPGSQEGLEADYKKQLMYNHEITFNSLFTITNIPINRFLDFLKKTDKLDSYMNTLVNSFNPQAVENVMCKSLISVGWDGKLYDCDFNQMLKVPVNSVYNDIFSFDAELLSKRDIVCANHCYGCTAGEGSSCKGSLI